MLHSVLISPEWLSILPPILALTFAFIFKRIIPALLIGLLSAEVLIVSGSSVGMAETAYHALGGVISTLWAILATPSSLYLLLFSLVIGALIALLKASGGVAALIERLNYYGYATTKRQAGFIPALVGSIIFIESYLSMLVSGLVGQRLYDKFKLGRARLALVVDTTASPISSIILINSWGALLFTLISQFNLDQPVSILAMTIPLNFYAWLILAAMFYTVYTGKVYGPLKTAHDIIKPEHLLDDVKATRSRYLILPLIGLILSVFIFMSVTGHGDFFSGDGAKSILLATLTGIAIIVAYLLKDKVMSAKQILFDASIGMKQLLPIVIFLWLALALGLSIKELGTGYFIVGLIDETTSLVWFAPFIFIAACLTSFFTGSSWGTYALIMPLAIPLSLSFDIPPELLLAAMISGGVWGDHCSPISETTVLSSLASGCDHMQHVKTQLPYALSAGFVAFLLFLLAGYILI